MNPMIGRDMARLSREEELRKAQEAQSGGGGGGLFGGSVGDMLSGPVGDLAGFAIAGPLGPLATTALRGMGNGGDYGRAAKQTLGSQTRMLGRAASGPTMGFSNALSEPLANAFEQSAMQPPPMPEMTPDEEAMLRRQRMNMAAMLAGRGGR